MLMEKIIGLVTLFAFILFINSISEFRENWFDNYPFNIKKIILCFLMWISAFIMAVLYNVNR